MMNIFRKGRVSDVEMAQWLLALRKNCYAPESGFCVTAVFRVRFGDAQDYYFAGVNAENIDHRLTTHAEEACIAAMVAGLGKDAEIAAVWVMGAPAGAKSSDVAASCCGKCRQQIVGFAKEDVKVHAVTLNGKVSTATIGALLPEAFTFSQYLADPDRVRKKISAAPSYEDVKKKIVRQSALSEQDIFTWLEEIESVDEASHVSQSLVLRLSNGSYVAGAKVEEAAFISINAAQGAVAIAVSEFGACLIDEAWVYTKGRDKKELPPGTFGTLPMSALQTLLQMSGPDEVFISFFTDDGDAVRTTLMEAAKLAPTSAVPFRTKAS